MLLRYRELYNRLTKSKAFDVTGQPQNSKIDKSKFTPNNLRYIILSGSHAFAVYYTTNKYTPKLFESIEFNCVPRNPEELEKVLTSNRGMIDALHMWLKFSNLEEIIFFQDGFYHEQEMQNELLRLQEFSLNTALISQSFKRLRGVGVVPGKLDFDLLSKLESGKSLFRQLNALGFPIQFLNQYSVERDEYKLPRHVELMSGENGYLYDTTFDPSIKLEGKEKEKYYDITRLSRHFYMERLKAKEAKEAEERKKLESDVKIDDALISSYADRILVIYKDLYSSCFNLKKPVGILTSKGILKIENNKTVLDSSALYTPVYNLIVKSSGCSIVEDTNNLEGISVRDLYKAPLNGSYYPLFHLAIMNGWVLNTRFSSWDGKVKKVINGQEVITSLEDELYKLVKSKLENAYRKKQNLKELVDNLCTSFAVTEYVTTAKNVVLMCKIKISTGNGKFNKKTFEESFYENETSIFSGNAKLSLKVYNKTRVCLASFCMNEELYQKMPLFGYEAVNHLKSRGMPVSIENCIIGQTVDDEILTIDLTNNNSKVINILAGPRAGKGVLTLNIIGTVLADGCPLIYMDAKPDMANVLNDLANKHGLRVAAWDLNTPPLHYLKSNPIIESLSDTKLKKLAQMGKNIPPELEDSTSESTMGLLAYLKVLQLTMVSAKLQHDKKVKVPGAGQAFFIMDELIRVHAELDVFYNIIEPISKAKDVDEELKNWCATMVSWITKLGQDFSGSMVSEMPNSKTSVFCLYQSAKPWRNETKVPVKVFRPLTTAGNATKLVGGSNATAEGLESLYVLASSNEHKHLATKVTQHRHFGMFTGTKLDVAENCTVFKSYLVLNNAEIDSQYVQDMRSNIGELAFQELLEKGNGRVPEGVGFEGFMNTIGEGGIQSLSRGYEYLSDIMEATGLSKLYGSVEEYLYDSDINSFFSKNALIKGNVHELRNGGNSEVTNMGGWDISDDYYNDIEEPELSLNNESSKPNTNKSSNDFIPPTDNVSDNPNLLDLESDEFNIWDEDEEVINDSTTNNKGSTSQHSNFKQNQYSKSDRNMGNTGQSYKNDSYRGYKSYNEVLKVDENPWKRYRGEGVFDKINMADEMTRIIMQDLEKFIGDPSFITSFKILDNGILVFNDIAYIPNFEDEFLNSLPELLRDKISRGNLVEFFNLKRINNFINLEELEIEDEAIAQGRARIEIGLGYRKRYSSLFKRFPMLYFIRVGDLRYYRDGDNEGYEAKESKFVLPEMNFFKRMFSPKKPLSAPRVDGWLGKVWESRQTKIITGALGWTIGAKVVYTVATFMGPWGLLFGGLAAASAIKSAKEGSTYNSSFNRDMNIDYDFHDNKEDNKKDSKDKKSKKK